AGPGFEVWAAAEPGAPRHAEATGLRWQAALTAAARHRRWCRRMPRSPGGGGGSAGRGWSCPAGVRRTRDVAEVEGADRIGAGGSGPRSAQRLASGGAGQGPGEPDERVGGPAGPFVWGQMPSRAAPDPTRHDVAAADRLVELDPFEQLRA